METLELTPARPRPSLLRAWWPALVWAVLICIESTDSFSSEHTGALLYRLIAHFYPNVNFHDVLVLNFVLRKTGHVCGYGILSLLLLRGWRATLDPARAWLGRVTLLSWLGTMFVAAMDEWHQSYIPSRTGTVRDVMLDSVAGLVFLSIAYLWLRRSGPSGTNHLSESVET
jgi:VanZ family protein